MKMLSFIVVDSYKGNEDIKSLLKRDVEEALFVASRNSEGYTYSYQIMTLIDETFLKVP
jgi:hypothetical protein